MDRICVIGTDFQEQAIMSYSLAYILGFNISQRKPAYLLSKQYKIKNSFDKAKWQDLLTYAFSSFLERVIIEQNYVQYVSNGCSLQDLIFIQSESYKKERDTTKRKYQSMMINSLFKVACEYSSRQYQCVVLFDSKIEKNQTQNEGKGDFRILESNLREHCKNIVFLENHSLEEALKVLLEELEIKIEGPIRAYIERAKQQLWLNK